MIQNIDVLRNYPVHYPMNFSRKLTANIVMKSDYKRADGTCALYLQVFLNKERKRFPCNISVTENDFDKVKQRIKKSNQLHHDYNLIIEKMLADINKIEVSYRLSNQVLTMDKLEKEYNNPSSRIDFIKFWENEMEQQKLVLKKGTYRQQYSSLTKLKAYKSHLYFHEITNDFLIKIVGHFKSTLQNDQSTISTFLKNFKKYLNIANKKGIITPLQTSEIKIKSFSGNRTFLNKEELQNLTAYYNDAYCLSSHKYILAKFLFSCFTGLRFYDVNNLTEDNFVGDVLVFTAEKTKKMQRITLNRSAMFFANPKYLLNENFTNEYVNRELKEICKFRGINKRVSFHVSRHTFATNFLVSGGRVEHLQKLLGHSNIRETMIYVHIVESITNMQVLKMDEILKL